MRYSIVIPVYLSRKDNEWREGDVVYDHPTPINKQGTLIRTLESLEVIKKESFDVILIISTTTSDIDNQVDTWLEKRITESKHIPKNLYTFKEADLKKLSNIIREKENPLLSISGYSQVRNCGLIAGIINESDAIIFLDDDELVKDKEFIKKVDQGLNKKINGKKIRFITGMCPEGESGSYIRERKYSPWMAYWDKIKFQNETFIKVIEGNPRFKLSPLTHGGLCVIHKDIFSQIPFDPLVQRGEDMDYNLNSRMFGYGCYMDNQLEIRHCPPPRIHEKWRSFREDMLRFLIQRNKIIKQNKASGIKVLVKTKDFYPYPGAFLGENLEEMIFKSQTTMALEYISKNDLSAAQNTLENINIARNFIALKDENYFEKYMKNVSNWKNIVNKIKTLKTTLRRA